MSNDDLLREGAKMADGLGKRTRVLYVLKLLSEGSDERSGLTEREISAKLSELGFGDDRRQFYDDIDALENFGYEIGRRGRPVEYYIAKRDFTLPELKLLVDAVQSSRFITAEKSDELIDKLEGLCSEREGRELSRSVHVQNRIKAMNESIYLNVDAIQSGISSGRQITFHYFKWNAEKKKELRRGGKLYRVSPFALTWTDDNYYMIAYDDEVGQIRHYRVDRMLDISQTDTPRLGREAFDEMDMGRYANSRFGMFGGEETAIRLECDNSIAGVIIDRFGLEPSFFKATDHSFYVTVRAVVSEQFFGWVLGLGDLVKICSPETVANGFHDLLDKISKNYD